MIQLHVPRRVLYRSIDELVTLRTEGLRTWEAQVDVSQYHALQNFFLSAEQIHQVREGTIPLIEQVRYEVQCDAYLGHHRPARTYHKQSP